MKKRLRWAPAGSSPLEHPVPVAGDRTIFFLDAVAAKFVEAIGEQGTMYARKLRDSASIRWQEFTKRKEWDHQGHHPLLHIWVRDEENHLPRFIVALTRIVWADIVGPRVAEARRKPPAVSAAVVEELIPIHRRGNTLDEQKGALASKQGEPLNPRLADTTLIDVELVQSLSSGIRLLATLPAHQLVRHLAVCSHMGHLSGLTDYRNIAFDGGWSGVAKAVGCGGAKSAPETVRRIVETLATLRWKFPDGSTGTMFAYRAYPAAPGRKARVIITVGECLLPGYVIELNKRTRRGRAARQLVPLPPLPPFTGRKRDWGGQANLQMAVMRFMHSHTDELLRYNGVFISQGQWLVLADEAGLPTRSVSRVLEAWLEGTEHSRPFLAKGGKELYSLHQSIGHLTDFMVKGSRVSGAKRGKRSSDSRGGTRKKRSKKVVP